MYRFSLVRTLLDLIMPRQAEDVWIDHVHPSYLESFSHTDVETPTGAYAVLRYKHPRVRTAVHALKYREVMHAATLLAYPLAPLVADLIAEERLFGRYTHPILVPTPLGSTRLRERGYNQAEEIARALAALLEDESLELRTDVLRRMRDTTPQTRQNDRAARLQNMHGVFKATPLAAYSDVILLDDVVTTGATLNDAARALREAGARNVLMLAAAH